MSNKYESALNFDVDANVLWSNGANAVLDPAPKLANQLGGERIEPPSTDE